MTDNIEKPVCSKAAQLALFRKEASFVAGADKPARLPKFTLPEFAFIGKSNVGKSSLVNSLCNRKSLARVSHTPGRTQQINFFQVGTAFILVDLPGYGFAKVAYNLRKSWEQLILQYLGKRDNLRVVSLLVDARRGIMDHDLAVIKLLQDMDRHFQIVFTKSDKISDRVGVMEASNAKINKPINFIFTSARSKDGTQELQLSLAKHL